jgi:hypothetical protein
MIRFLELENWKGIGARQRIDFAPLTLLFGANSAGKSTILQAFLYLHELIERGAADVDRTELGGSAVELGGFARLVNQHDLERAMVLRVEFATPGSLERFGRDLSSFPFPDLDDEVESAWIELSVRFLSTASFRGPIVERAMFGVNDEPRPLVWLEIGSTLRDREPLHAYVNMGHRVLASAFGAEQPTLLPHWVHSEVTEAWAAIAIPPRLGLEGESERDPGASGAAVDWDLEGLLSGEDPIPVFALERGRLSALPSPSEPLRVVAYGEDTPEKTAVAEQVRILLEMVVLGTTAQLASFLQDAQYIGPLRAIPPRGFLYERAGRVTSWADGLAAWDLLLADRLTLVERTNDWLRKLGAGCKVVVQQLFVGGADAEEISDDHVDKTIRRLLLDTGAGSLVLPSEVGAGISQLLPILVAAIEGRGGLALFEQPEIHVHPAVQVSLGDLLIDAAHRQGSRRLLLVETHSEHLILRLLRRIRETTENELAVGAPAFRPEDLSVLYVSSEPGGVRVRRLRVDDQGEFLDRWPKGFFAERIEELL